MKTKNRECQNDVTNCTPFNGSNLSGIKISDKLYVVYSYGHWPCWAKINGQWFGHESKYSKTTSAHTSGSSPEAENIIILDNVEQLKKKIAACK